MLDKISKRCFLDIKHPLKASDRIKLKVKLLSVETDLTDKLTINKQQDFNWSYSVKTLLRKEDIHIFLIQTRNKKLNTKLYKLIYI